MANKETLEAAIDYRRDFEFEYFGYKTLERSYLTKINGQIVERPQHLLVSYFILNSSTRYELDLIRI